MSEPIPKTLKRRVANRGNLRCEYCLLPETLSFYSFHIDHIVSLKHGGKSNFQNLAYCCPDCNFYKGSDLGTFVQGDEDLIRFFNPRKDKWDDHFQLQDGCIVGKTNIGMATERIFRFNEPERLIFRQQLIALALYP